MRNISVNGHNCSKKQNMAFSSRVKLPMCLLINSWHLLFHGDRFNRETKNSPLPLEKLEILCFLSSMNSFEILHKNYLSIQKCALPLSNILHINFSISDIKILQSDYCFLLSRPIKHHGLIKSVVRFYK